MNHRSWLTYWVIVIWILLLVSGCATAQPVKDHTGELVDMLIEPVRDQTEADNVTVLRLWTFYQANEFEFLEGLAEEYNRRNPSVEIKVEFIQLDDYFGTRLLSSFTSGQGPDVFFVSPGNIDKFVNADILHPLTERFTPKLQADFYNSALEAVTIQGDIYAVPFEIELVGLYYNRKMFEQHHLAPPRTWKDMQAAARLLKTDETSGLTIETNGSVYQNFTWLPFLWQNGANVLSEDQSRSVLDTPETIETLTFFQHMKEQGLLNLYPSRPTNDIGILANGETAMQVAGTWNIRALETIYADAPIEVVPLPAPKGAEPLSIAGGWKVAVNKHSEYLKQAEDFVMWAYAEDIEHPLKWCSEVKFAYSPRKSVMDAGKDYDKVGLRAMFTNQLFGKERPEPRLPSEVSRIFTDLLHNVLYGQIELDEAVRMAHERINEHLLKAALVH